MWQSLLDLLKQAWPSLVGAIKLFLAAEAGKMQQQAVDAESTLEKVQAANTAAAGVTALSDADVVRELQQRGLYRVSSQSSDGGADG